MFKSYFFVINFKNWIKKKIYFQKFSLEVWKKRKFWIKYYKISLKFFKRKKSSEKKETKNWKKNFERNKNLRATNKFLKKSFFTIFTRAKSWIKKEFVEIKYN